MNIFREYERFYFYFATLEGLDAAEFDVLDIEAIQEIGAIREEDVPMLAYWHENLKAVLLKS